MAVNGREEGAVATRETREGVKTDDPLAATAASRRWASAHIRLTAYMTLLPDGSSELFSKDLSTLIAERQAPSDRSFEGCD